MIERTTRWTAVKNRFRRLQQVGNETYIVRERSDLGAANAPYAIVAKVGIPRKMQMKISKHRRNKNPMTNLIFRVKNVELAATRRNESTRRDSRKMEREQIFFGTTKFGEEEQGRKAERAKIPAEEVITADAFDSADWV